MEQAKEKIALKEDKAGKGEPENTAGEQRDSNYQVIPENTKCSKNP